MIEKCRGKVNEPISFNVSQLDAESLGGMRVSTFVRRRHDSSHEMWLATFHARADNHSSRWFIIPKAP